MSTPAQTDNLPAPAQPPVRKPPVQLVGRQGDLDQAFRLAQALSHSQLVPNTLRGKPSDILVIVLYGQELGLPPMQAMQVIDVMNGRPSLRANLWVALARKAGHKVRLVESTAESATVTVIRHDDPDGPITATYTIADAKTAGLLSNTNYAKNPKAMLYARAASTAIRQACPEVAMGFSDEYELHAVDPDPEPVAGPVLASVVQQQHASQAVEPTVDDATLAAEYAELADDPALFPQDQQ